MKTSYKLLWALFALILLFMISLTTAMRMDLYLYEPEHGNGIISEKRISFDEIQGFTVRDNITASFVQADRDEVVIRTDSNLIDKLYIGSSGNWLEIARGDDFGEESELHIQIFARQIKGFTARNSAHVTVDSLLKGDVLDIRARNAAEIRLLAVANEIKLNARNSSRIRVTGESTDLSIESRSSSHVDAGDFSCQYAEAQAEGSSRIWVRVEQKLETNINGSSAIHYAGPETLDIRANGSTAPVPVEEGDPSEM